MHDLKTADDPGILARIGRSIFRGPVIPRTDRERRWVVFNHLVLHLRPMRLPASTLRYTHTFGLGGMSLVLVSLLLVTGVMLMFAYVPSPDHAHDSVVNLEQQVLFGSLVRNTHYWSANLVIVVILLHLARVFFTGAFHGPRQFNWVIGLGLLGLVLLSNFTGYLLPWDQLSYWAITISTGMVAYVPGLGAWFERFILGGAELGPATLNGFYAYHTTVSPVLIVLLMAFHFWRVRKAGGVVSPGYAEEASGSTAGGDAPRTEPDRVLFIPHLLLRETAVALILIAVVLLLATAVDAPLGESANPGMSPNPAKAPWYFLGFQELLLHFHPIFAVLVLPVLAAIALASVPYLRFDRQMSGPWFLTAKGRRMAIVAAMTAAILTPLWILLDEFVLDRVAWPSVVPPWISDGLLPVLLLLAAVTGFAAWIKRRYAASGGEAVQALFTLILVAFLGLTLIGIWFRGAGMELVWPLMV